jgi:RNA polymerase sigma factor (sigma-70 family)
MQCPGDETLAERAVAGDEAAFVELFSRHAGPVMALIRRLLDGEQDREDALQETLLHAWRDIGQLRDRSLVRPWLVSIARNRCRQHYRSPARRERPMDAPVLEYIAGRMGRMAPDPSEGQEAPDVLTHLAHPQRETLEMFCLNGMSIREIAARMSIPAGTVKSRLFHARRDLRRLLEE